MLYKYPRTYHLPWSLGITTDDKVIKSLSRFENRQVIVSVKMDGENSTLANGHIYARSLDSVDHPARHWLKNACGYLSQTIEKNIRICGENLFAEHSIAYENLRSYFYAFSIWEDDICLSWDDTLKKLATLGLCHVPVIYSGIWDEKFIRQLPLSPTENGEMEGYVVRLAESFKYDEFDKCVAKFVRANHVQTDEHWLHRPIIKNKLIKY